MNNLTVTEYQNQRILTTAQLAESYETESQVITNNFNRNKDRYQEGKHFYCLEGEEFKQFRATTQIDLPLNLNKLYLWTEKGCLHHAKSLGTDKAWEVFEMLEETYFNNQQALKPMSQVELTAAIAQNQVELERKVNTALEVANKLDSKLANALDVFTAPTADNWKHDMNSKINQIIEGQGFSHQKFRGDLYEELELLAHCNITARQSNLRKRMKEQGATYKDCQAATKLDVVDRDIQLKPIFEGIVRKYQAKYAI